MSVSDIFFELRDFVRDNAGPLGMLLRLPDEIEHSIAVFGDAIVAIEFHADAYQRVLRRIKRVKTFAAGARIKRFQLLEHVLLLKLLRCECRVRPGVVEGEKHVFVLPWG